MTVDTSLLSWRRPESDLPAGYWLPTQKQIDVAEYHDRRAAQAVNADNLLTDAEPFGTEPGRG